jgi:hypothetical protein
LRGHGRHVTAGVGKSIGRRTGDDANGCGYSGRDGDRDPRRVALHADRQPIGGESVRERRVPY